MKTCLCCQDRLLHHICGNRRYWFCPHCRQAMPATHEATIPSSASPLSDTVKS